jgi:hypothetical protein
VEAVEVRTAWQPMERRMGCRPHADDGRRPVETAAHDLNDLPDQRICL